MPPFSSDLVYAEGAGPSGQGAYLLTLAGLTGAGEYIVSVADATNGVDELESRMGLTVRVDDAPLDPGRSRVAIKGGETAPGDGDGPVRVTVTAGETFVVVLACTDSYGNPAAAAAAAAVQTTSEEVCVLLLFVCFPARCCVATSDFVGR